MNIHKILANAVVLAGFVAVPFIPFIILSQSTYFPFIVGKNFAFRVVVEIMFSAWIVLAVIDPAYRPKKSYLLGAFVAFLSIITLAAIFGENPTKSFWSNFERMEGVVTYFHLFAYFVVASTALTVRNLWRPYLNLHLAAGVIMAIYAVLQSLGDLTIVQDGTRVNGTLGNAAYLGTYALVNIFLAAFFMVRESFTTTGAWVRTAIYGAIVLLQAFVLYHTATRGAMYGLIAGVVLTTILVAIFEKKRKVVRMGAVFILIATAMLIGGFIAVKDRQFVKDSPVLARFAEVSFSDVTDLARALTFSADCGEIHTTTMRSRCMVWSMAGQGFKEHPALGWGMENFNYVFNKYYDPKMYDQEQWFDRAHNVFLDWLIAGGLPALLAYLSLFACALYCIWRRADELSVVEKSVLTGLLGGYFFQNLFVFDNLTSLIYFGTILAYVESLSHGGTSEANEVRPEQSKKQKSEGKLMVGDEDLTFMISGAAVIFAVILVYTVNYSGFMQNTTLLRAIGEKSAKEGLMHNYTLFKETLAYNSFGTSEARERLGQLVMSGFDRSKEIPEIQQKFLDLAASELAKQATELSKDARYQVFAGSFIARTGNVNDAIKYLERAAELSPKKQTILFELGSAYYGSKNLAKAEEVFGRAYQLDKEYVDAEKFYLQVLIANDKRAEAENILKDRPLEGLKL